MKRIFSFLLALVLTAGLMPIIGAPQEADAATTDTPVWKIAWVAVPESIVAGTTHTTTTSEKSNFWLVADYLKAYIEDATDGAVKIEITKIESAYPAITANVGFDYVLMPSNYPEAFAEYNLHLYDSIMFGGRVPLISGNSGYVSTTHTISLVNTNHIRDVSLPTYPAHSTRYSVYIHEFLHTVEYWFRDRMGYQIPIYWEKNTTGILEPHYHDRAVPSHAIPYLIPGIHTVTGQYVPISPIDNLSFFDLSEINLNENGGQNWNAWTAFLTGRIKDPFYGTGKHTLEHLGVSPEMWQYTPLKMGATYGYLPPNVTRTITWNTDGGSPAPVQISIQNGGTINEPALMTRYGYDFNEWYMDSDFVIPADFPISNVTSDMTFYAKWTKRNDGDKPYVVLSFEDSGVYINLGDESITLPPGFTVAAYSVNGGRTWKRGALPTGANFQKLFNKELTLRLTDGFDAKAKQPLQSATVLTFPKIIARPKRNTERIKPFYSENNWVLAKKGSTAAVFTGYEYSLSSNGKTPDGNWQPIPADGFPIVAGRTRQTFFVRAEPKADDGRYAPAGIMWRVRPVNFGKAPTLSIRQAKVNGSADRVAVIAFRKGDQYAIGDGDFTAALTVKTTIPVSQLSAQGTELRVRRAATGKRPPSEVQRITLPAPVAATSSSIDGLFDGVAVEDEGVQPCE